MANDIAGKEVKKAVKSILVSQPEPANQNSPYHKLGEKYGIKIDFRPFIEVKGVTAKEFRSQKINILEHTAVIFTSRNAIDHFFRLCKELKVEVPSDMKYFCISEQTANYLQKYIVVRKRKLFTGYKTARDMFDLFKKHKSEKYLFPCSDIRKEDIPNFMDEAGIEMNEAIIYRTVAADLSDLSDIFYDMIAFFSPSGIKSLFTNFPDFEQKETRIAAFGPTTASAVRDAGLHLDVEAPLPNAPSMTGAIELYIKEANDL
ncbi:MULTISPECIES: uroporphyrinogen-III synthase [Flammeovirga]|uniref:Uroporphyrinogen-III synthase n=1 Tax=Flammeovirga agarivorans TaxID=2726742 RepID=A0A7X8SQV7_9BACT|nr:MULTISPECIES: uroporphyrinogen-III synthase [Flammeovirga]NLR94740.1 uroporphyrinogen-III synthase [Flammeovirga agarivorans]